MRVEQGVRAMRLSPFGTSDRVHGSHFMVLNLPTLVRTQCQEVRRTGHLRAVAPYCCAVAVDRNAPRSTRAAFLDQFDPDLLKWVTEFADVILKLDHDVLIFTARKAACLYDAMRRVGLVAANGVVVSDRVLDLNLDWLKGKSVALVDDVIITGSSLYRAKQTLLAAGVAQVDTYALAIDQDNWVEDLVHPDGPHLVLPATRAINLCTQVVNALAVVPRPYNLDWPLIENVGVRTSHAHVLGAMSGWSTFATTNTVQHSAGVMARTHEPDFVTRREFSALTGLPTEVLSLTKVRTYSRIAAHDPTRVLSTVVPVVAFDDLTVREVDTIFHAIAEQFDKGNSAEFITPESRLRAIQFVLAARLGKLWLRDLDAMTHMTPGEGLAHNQITLAFSPPAAALVRSACACTENPQPVNLRPRLVTELSTCAEGTGPVPAADRSMSADQLMELLTEPFLALYETRELPARDLLKRYGRAAFDDTEYLEIVDRLNSGKSLRHLTEAVASAVAGQDVNPARAVSAFLDIAVDHGVAVPIMQFKDGLVQRAYRHGEDIVYSRNETRLFSLMLEAATAAKLAADRHVADQERAEKELAKHDHVAAAGGGAATQAAERDAQGEEPSAAVEPRGHLSKLQVEKLCVIFTRVGLQQGLFSLWRGRLGASGSLGTRWHLKGALMQENSSTIFGANLGNGLSDELVRLDVLKRRAKGEGYEFGRPLKLASTRPRDDAQASNAGLLLGQLLSRAAGRGRLRDQDLTLLASCFDLPGVVGALTAEVAVVANNWPAFSYRLGALPLTPARAQELSRSLVTEDMWEAAQSGEYKFTRYKSGRIQQILEAVVDSFDDPFRATAWQSFWPAPVGDDHRIAPELAKHSELLGRWLLSLVGYFWLLRLGLETAAGVSSGTAHNLNRAAAAATEQRKYTTQSDLPLWSLIDSTKADTAAGKVDGPELVEAVREAVELHMRWAESLMDKTKAVANPFGEARSYLSFDGALAVFPGHDLDPVELAAIVNRAVSERRRSAQGRQVRIDPVRFTNDPTEVPTVVARGGQRAYAYLTNIAERIAAAVDPRHGVRIALIPDLLDHEKVHVATEDPTGHFGAGFERLRDHLAERPQLQPGPGSQLVHIFRNDDAASVARVEHAVQGTYNNADYQVRADWMDTSRTDERALRVLTVAKSSEAAAPVVDLGIVTIIRPEAAAVRKWLTTHGQPDTNRYHTAIFHTGEVPVGDTTLRVAHIQASGQGDSAALSAFHTLTAAAHPRVVVLLGIAGGIHRDVSLGDVVIGSQVINYGAYAAAADGDQRRGHAWMIPVAMVNAIHDFLSGDGGERPLRSSDSASNLGKETFQLVAGPIGTGPAVVKFRDAEVRRWLEAFNDKTLALETEAEAVCRHFYERGEAGEVQSYLILRGISDHADEGKDDAWHEAAAANAVQALEALLPSITFMFPSQETEANATCA